MLIIFELRDDMISPDQASDLAQKSPLWTLSTSWRVQAGTLDGNVLPPIELDEPTNEEGPDDTISGS